MKCQFDLQRSVKIVPKKPYKLRKMESHKTFLYFMSAGGLELEPLR